MYDITSKESFEEIESLMNQILRAKGAHKVRNHAIQGQGSGISLVLAGSGRCSVLVHRPQVPMVIVANKVDLDVSNQRVVSQNSGKELAARFGTWAYKETSAKARIRVEEAFFELVREINKEGGPIIPPIIPPQRVTGRVKKGGPAGRKCAIL